MKKIVISGAIGYWGVEAFDIRNQLEAANGEDVEVDISSEGGSVFDGVEIYNLFSSYKKDFPNAGMICNIKSLAASMGSYIAINNIFDLVTTEDNASMMIHNPLNVVAGDYQVMRKNADFLERLAKMMSRAYSNRSGKSIDDIQKMMDDETWLFGKEIVDEGFADQVINTENSKDKDEAIAFASTQFASTKAKMSRIEMNEKEFDKAVASMGLKQEPKKPQTQMTDQNIKPKMEDEKIMDVLELKTKYPEMCNSIMQEGEAKNQDRVKSLMELKSRDEFKGIDAILMRVDEAIEKGQTVIDVQMAIAAMSLKGGAVSAAMDTNDIGDIDTGAKMTVSGEVAKIDYEDTGF